MQQILTIILGGILIVFRVPIAKFLIMSQNTIWGLKYGEKEIQGTKVLLIICGLGLIGAAINGLLKQ